MAINFTFDYLESEYNQIIRAGYKIITCEEYVNIKNHLKTKILVNRVDIDYSVKKAEILLDLFKKLNVKATFFIRLHAPEYNPFSFENYRILKRITKEGHELGYHSEIIDQSHIWNEDPKECLIRDIKIINLMFNTNIKGIASHGGITGYNNLDFWKNNKPSDFGLLYEAYDNEKNFNLFYESLYISDSLWIRWKVYEKGKLIEYDSESPSKHALLGYPIIYLLIHPETFYINHIYE